MNADQYAQYLRSTHWQQLKERYRAARDWKCAVEGCGRKKLELHHLTYERLWREYLEDVIPLCHGHHETTHILIDVVGKDPRTAHLAIGSGAKSGPEGDPEGYLSSELMYELGVLEFSADGTLVKSDIRLARRSKKIVSPIAKIGAKFIDRGKPPQTVLKGCIDSLLEGDPKETEFWIATAIIERALIEGHS